MEETNNVSVNYEEILEQMYGEMQEQTELLTELKQCRKESYVQLQTLNGSLVVVVAFLVLEFCWSCMRQWRKNLVGGSK